MSPLINASQVKTHPTKKIDAADQFCATLVSHLMMIHRAMAHNAGPLFSQLLALIGLFGLLLSGRSANSQIFTEIEVDIQTFQYRDGNTNARQRELTFHATCIVGTNQWRIDNDFSQNSSVMWFYDGTNVYRSSQLTKPPPSIDISQAFGGRFSPAVVPYEQAKTNITIRVHPAPQGDQIGDQGVNIPWLAFCSGAFLKERHRLPLMFPEFGPRENARQVRTMERFNDELSLPKRIEIVTGSAADAPLLSYSVAETTNFSNCTLPLRFELMQSERGANGNLAPRYRAMGVVTGVRTAAKPEGVFAPQFGQTIIDRRFEDQASGVDSIVYRTTNSFLLPTNSPELQKVLKQKIANMPRQRRS
jgi:hypothetical protein